MRHDFHHEMFAGLRRGVRMGVFGFPPGFPPGFPFDRKGGWGGSGGRGHRRGGRANVRQAVLALLIERPMHGYEMIQELDSRTNGIWRPSPGSIYPTLQLLEDEGLIRAESDGGRKRYTLTDEGRAEAATAAEDPPWTQFTDDTDSMSQAHDFREAAVGIFTALKQVGLSGTPEQREKALQVLIDTKRRLYGILAQGD